jgi:3,4-dihydroxy 2-butanone 4-phosphate synthase / GTP cyclohydrolase II
MDMDSSGVFDSVADAIDAIAAGQAVVVTDDEDRENEGDLVMAAAKASPESVNMMIRHARGLICVPTTEYQLRRLGINSMVASNREAQGTDFTVSVDAAEGISTGISAADRCRTIQILADPSATADQLVQPGHIFPLRARAGGVLQRAGHTEAAVDLAVLAGLPPTGLICEILNEDGTMARLPQLIEFRHRHNLRMISIKQLIEYRHQREQLVECIAREPFVCGHGTFELHVFRSLIDDRRHYALSLGTLGPEPTLVRVQAENLLHDVLAGDLVSRVGTPAIPQRVVDAALMRIAAEGRGVFLYMTQPGGGLHLKRPAASFSAPNAQPATDCAIEPASMDFRGYGLGAQILASLGLRRIRLLSSSRRRPVALDGYGLEILEQIPLA